MGDLTENIYLNARAADQAEGKALAIAKTLKKMGTMSDNDIAKVTDLPLHEVAAL